MDPIQPTNSNNMPTQHPAITPPVPFSRYLNEPFPTSSEISQSGGIKKWFSNDIFKVVTFFLLVIGVLGVTSTAFFLDKLSSDQFLGVVSSLLFLTTPSVLTRAKKKVVYQPVGSVP